MGLLLNGLVVGSVFIERLFALPGFGELIVVSVNRRDYPLIVGSTIIATMFVIGSNLLVDLIYPFLDPRVRLDQGAIILYAAHFDQGSCELSISSFPGRYRPPSA